jgi:hypothetical protein
MAVTPITVQSITRSGLETTYVAAAQDIYDNGMTFPNTGNEFVEVKQGVGARIMYVHNATLVDGLEVEPRICNIPANKTLKFGPWPKSYNDEDGLIHLTFDALTNTTLAVIRTQ